jgi:rhodanese-related sulfurtransferase
MAKRTSRRKKKKNQNNLLWVGVAVIVLIALIWITQSEPSPELVTVAEANQMREEGAFILDVRTQEEWEAGHIPGATLIPLEELEARISEVPQGVDIVVICHTGNRSQEAGSMLLKAGYTQVFSIAGGITEWINLGYEVVTGP